MKKHKKTLPSNDSITLNKILDQLCEKLADVKIYQSGARDLAKKELISLNEKAEINSKYPETDNEWISLHSMHFRDAKTGESKRYAYRETTIEKRCLDVTLQQNKQYGWLLTEAYEEFEDFLESIYAYIGWKNNDAWPMSDFGKIKVSESTSKDFPWFLIQSRKKRDIPQSILTQLRSLYPDLVVTETENKLNVNLRVAVDLVASLRHIIVHKGGIVDDKNKFIGAVLKKSGVYNNGNFHDGYSLFIKRYFGLNEYKNTVLLLELEKYDKKFIGVCYSHDLLSELTSYLMSYAVEICRNIDNCDFAENRDETNA